jgi:hypothetical protein
MFKEKVLTADFFFVFEIPLRPAGQGRFKVYERLKGS